MAKLGLRDRNSYDGLAEDDVDPNEVLGMTVALGDGRWLTLMRVTDRRVIDADWLDRDLNVPERRRLVDRLGLAWLTLDGDLWHARLSAEPPGDEPMYAHDRVMVSRRPTSQLRARVHYRS
jgi:hypothetical protein